MAYIYMDESGDLGFDFTKKRTSRYFVVTFLFVTDKRQVNKAVKKTFASMPRKHLRGHAGMLHAVNELTKTRQKLLGLLAEQDVMILTLFLDKKRVYTKLQDERDVLYNFITNTLLDRIMVKKLLPATQPIVLVASQRETNRFLNLNFKSYLEGNARRNHKLKLVVEIKTPHQEKGLQAVDMLSWSIFRKFEVSDMSYYDIFKHKIIEESSLYPL